MVDIVVSWCHLAWVCRYHLTIMPTPTKHQSENEWALPRVYLVLRNPWLAN